MIGHGTVFSDPDSEWELAGSRSRCDTTKMNFERFFIKVSTCLCGRKSIPPLSVVADLCEILAMLPGVCYCKKNFDVLVVIIITMMVIDGDREQDRRDSLSTPCLLREVCLLFARPPYPSKARRSRWPVQFLWRGGCEVSTPCFAGRIEGG